MHDAFYIWWRQEAWRGPARTQRIIRSDLIALNGVCPVSLEVDRFGLRSIERFRLRDAPQPTRRHQVRLPLPRLIPTELRIEVDRFQRT